MHMWANNNRGARTVLLLDGAILRCGKPLMKANFPVGAQMKSFQIGSTIRWRHMVNHNARMERMCWEI